MESLSAQQQLFVPIKPAYARVLLTLEVKALESRVFTYSIPEHLAEDVAIGVPVLVPFAGRANVTGFVVDLPDAPEAGFRIKDIDEVLDPIPLFDEAYYRFLEWVADFYATPISQVVACALPNNLVRKNKKLVSVTARADNPLAMAGLERDAQRVVSYLHQKAKAYTPKYLSEQLRLPLKKLGSLLMRLEKETFVEIRNELSAATTTRTLKTVRLAENTETFKLSARQQQIVDYLKAYGTAIPQSQVLEALETTSDTLKRLEARSVVLIEETVEHRDPLAYYESVRQKKTLMLSESQQRAVDAVLRGDPDSPYLLYGVTGSGKTEVYMEMTRRMLETGRSVLVMVPEIALTSQISRRFIEHFGVENIALWHSNLSAGEKADTWRRLAAGDLKILIGARSAIWAPLKNPGLVLIDEEHDGSFKQDSPAPRYNAKTCAMELARRNGATVVRGSATPDLESFYHARAGKRILPLPERFGGRSMATVEIVDMKQERAEGNPSALSRRLKDELAVNFQVGEQSIILINRRGYYTIVTCNTCEHVFSCPNCDVALTLHLARQQVRCHYCGHEEKRPVFCPQCAASDLNTTGVGTQRVEDDIIKLLPEARVLRLDGDVLQRKNAYREIFEAFASGEADILIGTQMVAKGLDVPNVTLVGVVSADSSFALPDFKSCERGFQLLTQVAGRAGRGEKKGRVILQAVQPDHKVFRYSQAQDYEGFYFEEIQTREELLFPPFSQLFRFIISCENEEKTRQFSQAMAYNLQVTLRKEGLGEHIHILGPAPCVVPRIQGRYRYHCLLKNLAGEGGHRVISRFYLDARPPEDVNFILDIDTQSLL